jgi:MATE family multidrug resistance protein
MRLADESHGGATMPRSVERDLLDQSNGRDVGYSPTGAAPPGQNEPVQRSGRQSIRIHVLETVKLAGPIAAGQLSNQAMQTTTLILLGFLSADALAAGGLAVRVAVTTNILSGILLAVGVSIAVAQGAGETRRIASLYWNGLYLALLLSTLSFAWFTEAHLLLTALDQPPEVVRDTRLALEIMRWGEPANLIRLGLMRGVLPAFGLARALYALTPLSIGIYIAVSLLLAKGGLGLPARGWLGIPIAMVVANWISALIMLGLVHGTRCRERVPLARASLADIGATLRLGLPFGILQTIDGLFFFTITLMMGRLGAAALAAHQIVMSYGSIAAAFAASCGDAAALRIGFRRGQRAWADARAAGFVAIAISVTLTTAAAAAISTFPDVFLGFFINVNAAENRAIVVVAQSLTLLSSLFVFVEGFFGAGMGALRGLDDIRFPMLVAPIVYWGVGLPVGHGLSSNLHLGATGLWCGMVTSLSLIALVFVWRFTLRSHLAFLSRVGRTPTALRKPLLAPATCHGDNG